MRLPGVLRKCRLNPLNRRKQAPDLRSGNFVAVPKGDRKMVIPNRRKAGWLKRLKNAMDKKR